MDLSLALTFALGLLAGAVAALKVIAPRTKTKKDDKLLKAAEKAQDFLAK